VEAELGLDYRLADATTYLPETAGAGGVSMYTENCSPQYTLSRAEIKHRSGDLAIPACILVQRINIPLVVARGAGTWLYAMIVISG